jgi:hypothetical protein
MSPVTEVTAYTCDECGQQYTGKRKQHLQHGCPVHQHAPRPAGAETISPKPKPKKPKVPVDLVSGIGFMDTIVAAVNIVVGRFGAAEFETRNVRHQMDINGEIHTKTLAAYIGQALDRLCDAGEIEVRFVGKARTKKYKARTETSG